jgi:opacity protein-like surface antigen
MNKKIILLMVTMMLIVVCIDAGFAQSKAPISFEGIIRLPDFGLSSKQIADQITQSGLSFEVTRAHIDSLQRLGFDNTVINAVRQFYRMGTVQIVTMPAQVSIFVDNEPQGVSDARGNWAQEVPRGAHSIRLEKSGYAVLDTSVTVIKDRTVSLQLSLQKGGGIVGSQFFGRYGASFAYGISVISPSFDDDSHWKSGNNLIFGVKANVMPYLFVDLDLNLADFSKFEPDGGADFGSLDALNITVIPNLYKEFKEKYRGYLGLGIELNSSKIENGKFEDDGVVYMLDEKGGKTSLALLLKLGGEALVKDNIFLFAEYRSYSVLSQYAMSFIAIGMGAYIN